MKHITLEEIREISVQVDAFLKKMFSEALPDGRYYLENGIYVNVESYITQKKEERKFESHKRYVDIQFILSGEENILVAPVQRLSVCEEYSVSNDITFYNAYSCKEGEIVHLTVGQALLLKPEDGHMPCIRVEEDTPTKVRKAVIKIPLSVFVKIKYLVMDVDGTLTDGKIYMGETGEVCKAFNIKDGCGIHDILPKHSIEPVVITARRSLLLEKRCKELGIKKVYQGVTDKMEKLKEVLTAEQAQLCNVAYIGDDRNDLSCMTMVKQAGGLVGCPGDSVSVVGKIADFISGKGGGDGAVRDFIDWIVG